MSSFGGMLAFSVAAAHDPNNLEGMEASLRVGQVVDDGIGAHVALKGVEDFAAARSARSARGAYGARPGRANRAVSSEDEAGVDLPSAQLAGDVRSINVRASATQIDPAATVRIQCTRLEGSDAEFMRQLAGQESGINRLTAGEIRSNIEAFNANGRPSKAGQAIADFRRENPCLRIPSSALT